MVGWLLLERERGRSVDEIRIDVNLPATVHETPEDEAIIAIPDVVVPVDHVDTGPTTVSIVIDAELAVAVDAQRLALEQGEPETAPELPVTAPAETRRARKFERRQAVDDDPQRVDFEPWFESSDGSERPEGFWRELVHGITFDQVNLGDAAPARARKELDARIAAPIGDSARFVPVVSRKGGVGSTTVTALLGMALAESRADRVLAIDAHPDRGTLADRVSHPADASVRDIVRRAARLKQHSDVDALLAHDRTGLDVMASDTSASGSIVFDHVDYEVVSDVAARHFALVLTDVAGGVRQPTARAALRRADALLIVSGGSAEEARFTSEALDWLDENGYGELVATSVVALNTGTPATQLDLLDDIEAHFRWRVREVVRIPYDEELATGTAVRFAALRPFTRDSARELAAVVVAGLRPDEDDDGIEDAIVVESEPESQTSESGGARDE